MSINDQCYTSQIDPSDIVNDVQYFYDIKCVGGLQVDVCPRNE